MFLTPTLASVSSSQKPVDLIRGPKEEKESSEEGESDEEIKGTSKKKKTRKRTDLSTFPTKKIPKSKWPAAKKAFLKFFGDICAWHDIKVLLSHVLSFEHIYLIHMCDRVENFPDDLPLVLDQKVFPKSGIFLLECWDVASVQMVCVELTLHDHLRLAAIFNPATPTVKHQSVIVPGVVPVKHIYLVMIIHENNDFTRKELAAMHKILNHSCGFYGIPEMGFISVAQISDRMFPAGWWYFVIKSLYELFPLTTEKKLVFVFIFKSGFSWLMVLMNLIE